uniref:Uncharacterized protein n=1 Tax=Brassica oleracea TaxID=3712 RepID=A0A3P6DW67_BRAOL|nr:unnamed protein product [Brassica oleracea]
MSASIVHHENQNNPDQIDYSTCKIIRVVSYRDLGFTNLHTQKPFNTLGFYIPGYTYTDYQNAFFYTFFRRPFTHSWFIQFQFNCPKLIPNWFYEWWYYFGPVDQIYPEPYTQNILTILPKTNTSTIHPNVIQNSFPHRHGNSMDLQLALPPYSTPARHANVFGQAIPRQMVGQIRPRKMLNHQYAKILHRQQKYRKINRSTIKINSD